MSRLSLYTFSLDVFTQHILLSGQFWKDHRKTYKALKNFGDLNQFELEDSVWGVMAVETIIEVFEEREARKGKSVSSGYLSSSSWT